MHKRPDGKHEIASLNQAINFGDTLEISLQEGGKDTLTCCEPSVPLDSSNLVLRAAEMFRKKAQVKKSFAFHLTKKIPMESGLGGGSSNAATTLWGLNQLLKTDHSDETLAQWGGEIGADVPFFFSRGRAFCQGIGEKLTLLDPVEVETLYVAKPKEGLSTAAVYQNTYPESLPKIDPQKALNENIYFNDLEISAFQLMPSLKKLKSDLKQLGFEGVHMTGSGTAFFCTGSVKSLTLADVEFTQVQFISRSRGSWYKLS